MDNETRARLEGIEAAIDELSTKLDANFAADQAQLARVEALSKRTAVSVDKQTILLVVLSGLLVFLFVQGALSGQGVDKSLIEMLVPVLIALAGGAALLPKKG